MHARIYLYSGNGYGNGNRSGHGSCLCGRLTQNGDQNISRSSNKLHTSGLGAGGAERGVREEELGAGCRLSSVLTVGRTFFLINLCGMRYAAGGGEGAGGRQVNFNCYTWYARDAKWESVAATCLYSICGNCC